MSSKPHPSTRVISLLRTGPAALLLRFVDQGYRLLTGAPLWRLSQIQPRLYIGGQHYARGCRAMRDRGVCAIVNLREIHHSDGAKGIAGERHLHLPTIDNTPPSVDDLLRGVAFVQGEIGQGGSVYIHCGVGVGRAPTLASACLIAEGRSPDAALRRIKRVRPFVHLTPGQRSALDAFAVAWRDNASEPSCRA